MTIKDTITIDGEHLTLADIQRVADAKATVELAPAARAKVAKSHAWVAEIVAKGKPVYGINTGFGALSDAVTALAHGGLA